MPENSPELTNATHPVGNLLEFLGWVAARPRTYEDTMEAWRTSCPRLSAWEDALSDQLVRTEQGHAAAQGQVAVLLTEQGAAFLGGARAVSLTASNCLGSGCPPTPSTDIQNDLLSCR